MSEKEFELLAGIVKDNQSRLSELEKKVEKQILTFQDFAGNEGQIQHDTQEQIASLKEDQANEHMTLTNLVSDYKRLESVLSKTHRCIMDLCEDLETHFSEKENWRAKNIDEIRNRIIKLQEDLSGENSKPDKPEVAYSCKTNEYFLEPDPNDDIFAGSGWHENVHNYKQEKKLIAKFIEKLMKLYTHIGEQIEGESPLVPIKRLIEEYQQRLDD